MAALLTGSRMRNHRKLSEESQNALERRLVLIQNKKKMSYLKVEGENE